MAISFITGTDVTAAGTGTTSVTVTTHTVGDVIMLGTFVGAAVTVTGVSGGGASWAQVASPFTTAAGGRIDVWAGTVTSVVTSNAVTCTFSASVAADTVELDTAQFTAGLGASTTWTRDGTQQGGLSSASSTTIKYPSLTAAAGGELYFGKAIVGTGGAALSGTPASATFDADAFGDPFCWALPTGAGALQPIQNNTSTGTSDAVGVFMVAATGSPAVVLRSVRVVGQAVTRAAFF